MSPAAACGGQGPAAPPPSPSARPPRSPRFRQPTREAHRNPGHGRRSAGSTLDPRPAPGSYRAIATATSLSSSSDVGLTNSAEPPTDMSSTAQGSSMRASGPRSDAACRRRSAMGLNLLSPSAQHGVASVHRQRRNASPPHRDAHVAVAQFLCEVVDRSPRRGIHASALPDGVEHR